MKLALSGTHNPLTLVGTVKRAWTEKAARRMRRPLEDVDGWSDQAEVAFYEDSRLSRCG